ncbi:MAG: sugar kinase, partial [Pseudomonadota bacterium]
ALGEALVELNEVTPGTFRQGFGGDTSNVAIAAARQGAAAAYVTRLGADAFGDALAALWAAEGVTAHAPRDAEAPTGLYFVTHGADGHRFTYRRKGSAASRMRPADLPEEAIRGAGLLHLSGITLAISAEAADTALAAIALAREAGVRVSLDPNYRPALWPLARARALIHAAMAEADIALPGLEDARALTGLDAPEAIAEAYLAMGPRIVALTLGAEGVLVATPDRVTRIAPHDVAAVDATGAGDCFDGAFLARLLAGDGAEAAARYANAAAALATTGHGAVAPIPRPAEVRALLG